MYEYHVLSILAELTTTVFKSPEPIQAFVPIWVEEHTSLAGVIRPSYLVYYAVYREFLANFMFFHFCSLTDDAGRAVLEIAAKIVFFCNIAATLPQHLTNINGDAAHKYIGRICQAECKLSVTTMVRNRTHGGDSDRRPHGGES